MMTSSNGNIFRFTVPLCGEFTGHRWIPLTKASDAELWCFLWSVPSINGWVIIVDWWFETLSRSLWRLCNESSHQQRGPEHLSTTLIPLIAVTHVNTLRPRQKDAISQTTFSNAISWMKMYGFRLIFHGSLFLIVQLTIFQHCFR